MTQRAFESSNANVLFIYESAKWAGYKIRTFFLPQKQVHLQRGHLNCVFYRLAFADARSLLLNAWAQWRLVTSSKVYINFIIILGLKHCLVKGGFYAIMIKFKIEIIILSCGKLYFFKKRP